MNLKSKPPDRRREGGADDLGRQVEERETDVQGSREELKWRGEECRIAEKGREKSSEPKTPERVKATTARSKRPRSGNAVEGGLKWDL
jgi:hypothetical protein